MAVTRTGFPTYGKCPAEDKLDDLVRLLKDDPFETQYMDAASGAKLVATALQSYKKVSSSKAWKRSKLVEVASNEDSVLRLLCAALFDLVCNAEYLHGRITGNKWIYCSRKDNPKSKPVAYYSFLKQCPKCCQDHGLEDRLSGAQHKPSSHHIGEITTTAMSLFLLLLGRAAKKPLEIGVISKQSHDVDAVGWLSDLIVLFEIKASPLVTYPVRAILPRPLTVEGPEGRPIETQQHKLIDIDFPAYDLSLYLANIDFDVPLGSPQGDDRWPYTRLTEFVSSDDGLLRYFEAWLDVFFAYRVPKTEREGRQEVLGYLANGWGDEIDSNKTKAGLGRTDDIKKGTYQLLKYGAYYRAGSPRIPIRGALVANLDPLFMYSDYMEKLLDARWASSKKFVKLQKEPGYLKVADGDLYYVYDAVLTFNRPVINDSTLSRVLDFQSFEKALTTGKLDSILDAWLVRS